jgi:hypothetical protein
VYSDQGTSPAPARAAGACCLLLLLLAACSSYGPGDLRSGHSEADVTAKMGLPTERMALPGGGSRLDFARGPYGPHTYRVTLDAAGRVQDVRQLLDEANFEALRPDMSRAEVIDRLGRPSQTRTGWRGVGEVWSYRYEWHNLCRWFQVWLVDGTVRESAYAPDPLCEEGRRIKED